MSVDHSTISRSLTLPLQYFSFTTHLYLSLQLTKPSNALIMLVTLVSGFWVL